MSARRAFPDPAGGRDDFHTTRWTLIQQAGGEDATSREAMEELCSAYWYPLYAFVRRRGHDATNACDLTQGFFEQLLRRGSVAVADQQRGRFRHFLLKSLSNFLSNQRALSKAQRRGGGATHVPIDSEYAETRYQTLPHDDLTPDKTFARAWALSVLEQTLSRLRAGYVAEGKSESFDALKQYLNFESDGAAYEATARLLNQTAASVKTAVYRLRRRYRDTLRGIIAETVDSESEIDDEIAFMFQAVKR